MTERDFEVVRHSQITTDIQEAIDYYNHKIDYLGNEFYALTISKLKSLRRDALLYQIRYKDVRCAKISRFPFMIHYTVDSKKNKVFAHAIVNTSKNPKKNWKKRKF